MIERDYILNLVTMLAKAIAKIFMLKEAKKYDDALVQLDEASLSILGFRLEMFENLPISGVKDLFGPDNSLSGPKLYIAGRLLSEQGELFTLMGQEENGTNHYMKSLLYFMESLKSMKIEKDHRTVQAVDFVLNRLEGFDLPQSVKKELVFYNEELGRFGKAEDTIFEIIDEEPAYLNEAISYYERILSKSDDELSAGNLPREEAEESLAELRHMQDERNTK